jgi:hypothetical protein
MRKALWSSVRNSLRVTMVLASLWVGSASSAHEHVEGTIGEELPAKCGYYTEGGHAYYSNCDTFIGHWIEWNVQTAKGDAYQGAYVSRATTLPLGPADEVEFLVSVGISRKSFPAQGDQWPNARQEKK